MSKRAIIIAVIIIVIVAAGAGGLVFALQKKASPDEATNPVTNTSNFLTNLTSGSEESVVYEDESGFSFSYPKSLEVADETPNDDAYYTVLKLSKGSEALTITIKDGNTNPYKTDKSATLVGSTSLGGIGSSQYQVKGRLSSIAIDQGVIYIIDGPKDGGFWEDSQAKILSTFKFAGAATAADTTDSNTTYEEEVVE